MFKIQQNRKSLSCSRATTTPGVYSCPEARNCEASHLVTVPRDPASRDACQSSPSAKESWRPCWESEQWIQPTGKKGALRGRYPIPSFKFPAPFPLPTLIHCKGPIYNTLGTLFKAGLRKSQSQLRAGVTSPDQHWTYLAIGKRKDCLPPGTNIHLDEPLPGRIPALSEKSLWPFP
jgi:hypothetical protein